MQTCVACACQFTDVCCLQMHAVRSGTAWYTDDMRNACIGCTPAQVLPPNLSLKDTALFHARATTALYDGYISCW